MHTFEVFNVHLAGAHQHVAMKGSNSRETRERCRELRGRNTSAITTATFCCPYRALQVRLFCVWLNVSEVESMLESTFELRR
jgi:hypothetical protein